MITLEAWTALINNSQYSDLQLNELRDLRNTFYSTQNTKK